MKVYKVGGAVRDKLLGLPVKDQDWVVVGSTPEELSELGYKPVGKDFPVFLHPDSKEEYALARTERKTAPGYKGFAFNTSTEVSLEEDLIRRDLTINALAEDEQSNIIDCFNGQEDLKAGILRHISPAFVEDPLRVLRVARFAARFNFQVADETGKLMQTISDSGELDTLVAERVWTELERALNEKYPVRFFEVLRDCGALEKVFPEIDRLFGVPQPELHHPEIDSGIHTMMVLEQSCKLTEDPLIRFAALVHDLGKGTTPKAQWPSHRGHEERSVKLIQVLCDRYRIPGRYRDLAVIVARHHLDCHRIKEMRADTILRKLEAMDAFRRPERFEQFLLACEADIRGRKGFENRPYPQAQYLQAAMAAANNIDTGIIQKESLSGKKIA
ncbi:MAG: multifunctional CCA addition/repair protein, partial [Gammaproteobacteria bacterium]|nr:multifunctional CCA addition/repair protein [Gammaproteobacteria bacterium]